MKLAWIVVVGLVGIADAETQVEIAAKTNRAGVTLMADGKLSEAAAKFEDAFARDPEASYAFNLCTAAYQQGKFDEALTACNAVYNLQPTDAVRKTTNKLVEKIKSDAAAQTIAVIPTAEADPHREGVDLMLASKYAEAVPKFKASIARDLFNLCTAEYELGQFREALDACKSVVKWRPVGDVQAKTDKLIAKIRADAKSQKITIE